MLGYIIIGFVGLFIGWVLSCSVCNATHKSEMNDAILHITELTKELNSKNDIINKVK